MDSENENIESEQQEIEFDVIPLQDRYEKVLNLGSEAQVEIDNITKNSIKKTILNSHIDPRNEARIFNLQTKIENIEFKNFMTKKKNQSKKKNAFNSMREMLEEKGYQNISTIADREHRSIMIVRFVNKVDNQPNVMEIEDDLSKERERIIIRQGIVYVGLICAIEAVYENQMYRLEKVIDLSSDERENARLQQQQTILKYPSFAYRMLMLKGPFWKNDSKDNFGLQLIVNQIETLRYKENIRVDLIVVMGPFLSQHNEHVKNFTLDKTFEEEVEDIIETLKSRVHKFLPDCQFLIIPSTDDVISNYPIPQPVFDFRPKQHIKFASNPCTLKLDGSKPECKINFINYDLINYIDELKCGRSTKEVLIENIETYLKQPFFISNTLEDATFDETNFSGVFNRGNFGNVIVMSSQRNPVFAHKVKGNKLFVSIGSLGVDYHAQDKHFMALMSIYDGEGDVCDRIRVESIIM